jgi:bacillithiol system protein YtxJ
MAKSRFDKSPDSRLRYLMIDVVRHRSVSNALAERFGVRHESPQAFLVMNNQLCDVKSHLAIVPSSFSSMLDEQLSA